MGRAIAISISLALAIAASPAAASPGLIWHAPDACPAADEVELRIERRLGAPAGDSVRGIEVAIAQERGGFVARIDTGAIAGDEIRTLTSARCDELTDAVALIVARLATEARLHRAGAPRGSRVDGVARAPVPRWGAGIRAMAVSGIGVVPRVGLAGELAGYVRRRAAFGELAITRWADSPRYLFAAGEREGFAIGLTSVTTRGGWASERMPLRAWGALELGSMGGRAATSAGPRADAGRWIAVGAGFGVAWPMSLRSRLVGTFELDVVLTRPQLMLSQGGEIHGGSPASARSALGVELAW